MPFLSTGWLSVIAAVLLVERASAIFGGPEWLPVEQLLRKAEEDVAKSPKNASAVYTLARVHYLAFAAKRNRIPGFRQPTGPEPAPASMDPVSRNGIGAGGGSELTSAERLDHAVQAWNRFAECLRLDPTYALGALGQASLLEQLLDAQAQAGGDLPKEFRTLGPQDVWKTYVKAFSLGVLSEEPLKGVPEGPSAFVSHEAATALLRLGKSRRLTGDDHKTLEVAQERIRRLRKLPYRITPIVFALRPVRKLTDLLVPNVTVDFNLRGYGFPERWPWVKPELGFLAWDPLESGRIESGQQLFGSYTFQIFWQTGYHALATLDDNRDGTLSGSELRGLSVWFDCNSDGRSSAGEVIPLRGLGVVALQTTATSREGKHPMNTRGIAFVDGRILPTWDWVVEPVKD